MVKELGMEGSSGRGPSPTAVAQGRKAEDLAVSYLTAAGFEIVARNHRCPGGEVDLIGWEEGVLCFIEVRSRRTDAFGDPLETLDWRKRQRIIRAASHYLHTWVGPWPPMRFDALGMVMEDPPRLTLIREAFET